VHFVTSGFLLYVPFASTASLQQVSSLLLVSETGSKMNQQESQVNPLFLMPDKIEIQM